MNYTYENIVRLAKRAHNTKRTYLLVDPLQGKHIPVSPTDALDMMQALGQLVKSSRPETDIVIGFAETATAISSVIALCYESCLYLQTTREPFPAGTEWIEFQEEHSHATEQTLCSMQLKEYFRQCRGILLVDDEISTGKTILNIVHSLRTRFPEIEGIPVTVASVLNRLTEERVAEMEQEGITYLSLVHLPFEDLTDAVKDYQIHDADICDERLPTETKWVTCSSLAQKPRLGTLSGAFRAEVLATAEKLFQQIRADLAGKTVRVIGTEEFMYAPLCLAKEIEQSGAAEQVLFHATTRSPIGLCDAPGYPIRNGITFPSFYDPARTTFLYNIGACDVLVIFTDSENTSAIHKAAGILSSAFAGRGCGKVIVISGGSHV